MNKTLLLACLFLAGQALAQDPDIEKLLHDVGSKREQCVRNFGVPSKVRARYLDIQEKLVRQKSRTKQKDYTPAERLEIREKLAIAIQAQVGLQQQRAVEKKDTGFDDLTARTQMKDVTLSSLSSEYLAENLLSHWENPSKFQHENGTTRLVLFDSMANRAFDLDTRQSNVPTFLDRDDDSDKTSLDILAGISQGGDAAWLAKKLGYEIDRVVIKPASIWERDKSVDAILEQYFPNAYTLVA